MTPLAPCLSCGLTVAHPDPGHNCTPPDDVSELVAQAWWAGHEAGRREVASEVEALRQQHAEAEWLLRMSENARDRAERRLEAIEEGPAMTAPDRPTPDAHAAEREAMAKVLAQHLWHHTKAAHCACGWRSPLAQLAIDGYLAHVADVLVAAGFGPVADIEAQVTHWKRVAGHVREQAEQQQERAERAEDLVAEFRKREESQDRIRERLTAELAEARARLVAVAALAEKWEAADGEPVSAEGLTALNVTNRCGRELRHVLDNPAAALASVKAETLREAADECHKEARWQGEQVVRQHGAASTLHHYAQGRVSLVEQILRDRADRIEGDHV